MTEEARLPADLVARLRRWTYGDHDTHAVLRIAGARVADVPLIAHAEALMADLWEAADCIEAQITRAGSRS